MYLHPVPFSLAPFCATTLERFQALTYRYRTPTIHRPLFAKDGVGVEHCPSPSCERAALPCLRMASAEGELDDVPHHYLERRHCGHRTTGWETPPGTPTLSQPEQTSPVRLLHALRPSLLPCLHCRWAIRRLGIIRPMRGEHPVVPRC